MNTYKGIVILSCEKKQCPMTKDGNVNPGCINCTAEVTVVDLEGRELARLSKMKISAGQTTDNIVDLSSKRSAQNIKKEEVTRNGI